MWQPIETAPKDGIRILLASDKLDYEIGGEEIERKIVLGFFLFGKWYVADTCCYNIEIICPTHWMPLPELPTEYKGE